MHGTGGSTGMSAPWNVRFGPLARRESGGVCGRVTVVLRRSQRPNSKL